MAKENISLAVKFKAGENRIICGSWLWRKLHMKCLHIPQAHKGPLTTSKCETKSEKDLKTIKKIKEIRDKHQIKFSCSLSLGVNGP